MRTVLGWSLFVVGYLYFWAAHLQYTAFIDLLPGAVLMLVSAGLLTWQEWLGNMNPNKRISKTALFCFLLGLVSFTVQPQGDLDAWALLVLSVVVILLGVRFKLKIKKEYHLLGNALSVLGMIVGGTMLSLWVIISLMKKFVA